MTAGRCDGCDNEGGEIRYSALLGGNFCAGCVKTDATLGKQEVDPTTPLQSFSSSLVPRVTRPSVAGGPSVTRPSVTGGGRSTPERRAREVESLLESYAAGRLTPVAVLLPPLPDNAYDSAFRVADFFALVHGLRLCAGDPRPVPFACGWVATKLELPKKTAHRAISHLVGWGTLRLVESLPGRGGKRGTRLYLPGPLPAGVVHEPSATAVDGVAVDRGETDRVPLLAVVSRSRGSR